jgi:hypothetical protein
MTTSITNKANILADLWLNYRQDDEFADFIEYNDIGLPLAYVVANNIVELSPMAEQFISETFLLLLAGLGLDEDETEYETLDDLLGLEE